MGTTATDLRSAHGNRVGFVLAIEGYPYLLTDSGDTSVVATAWAASDFDPVGVLSGLKIHGQIKQAIEPWTDNIDVPRLTFVIQPDVNDTLGKAIWKTKPTFETRLGSVFVPASDGTGTLTVKQTISAGGTGTVYIGGKTATYSSKTGTSFDVSAFNVYSPFTGDAGKYVPGHGLACGDHWETAGASKVQDVPVTWIGKKVALYIHRIRGEVWDTQAQAQLEFAGKITRISEDDDGQTVIECEDLRALIRDCVLLKDQWIGYVKEGINLKAGWKFRMNRYRSGTATLSATNLTVVESGASGTDQINAGYVTCYELASAIEKWLAADANLLGNGSTNYGFSCKIALQEVGGNRTVIALGYSTSAEMNFTLYCNDPLPLEFLGFTSITQEPAWHYIRVERATTTEIALASDQAPFRARGLTRRDARASGYIIDLDGDNCLTWFDHAAYLPETFHAWTSGGENYSFLEIGGVVCFGKYESSTRLSKVVAVMDGVKVPVRNFIGAVRRLAQGLTVDDPEDHLEVRQLIVLGGSLSTLLPRLLASVDGEGTNHATYDVFPFGAGIPWSLLGSGFTDSLKSLEQTDRSTGLVIVLGKPTKLLDVLLPEFALRLAWIVFKDGGYQLVSPPTPNALAADHDLTEGNKAGPAGMSLRSGSEVTHEYLKNVIKVEYNRNLSGEYEDVTYVKDQKSISDYGESKALTIKAANSSSDTTGAGAALEDLLVALTTKILPFWSKPIKLVHRSIAPTLYHMAPGDTVSLTDDFVRDPVTGERGLSNRGGVVLSVVHDWGQEGGQLFGEVVIAISDEDRTYPMSPCAQVDHTYSSGGFTNGYNNGAVQLKLVARTHADSSDAVDVSHFDAGDVIRIIQIDPANPASVTAWDRVIASSGVDTANNIITLTAVLSAPSFDTALRYRVVPQSFTSVQASQKLHAFIADDTDGLVLDAAQANMAGEFTSGAFTVASLATLPSLLPDEADDEGKPLHVGLVADLGNMLNNLTNHKCAVHVPMVFDIDDDVTETGTSYQLRYIFPIYIGGFVAPGTTRYLKIAPRMKTSADTGYCRVTISRQAAKGESLTAPSWNLPYKQLEFTTTSTTAVEVTAQNALPILGGLAGWTWLAIELKASATRTTTLSGLPRLYLGPEE